MRHRFLFIIALTILLGTSTATAAEPVIKAEAADYFRNPMKTAVRPGFDLGYTGGNWYGAKYSVTGVNVALLVPWTYGVNVRISGSLGTGHYAEEDPHSLPYQAPGDRLFDIRRLSIALMACSWPNWSAGEKRASYAYAGLGLVNQHDPGRLYRNPGEVVDPSDPPDPPEIDSGVTKLSSQLGIGIITLVTETVGIDLGLELDAAWVGSGGKGSGFELGTILEVKAGLIFVIG